MKTHCISLTCLLLIFIKVVYAVDENELLYNRTSSELVNLLKDLTANQYQTNISAITKKLDECYFIYHHASSSNLFFLERSLRDKITNITEGKNTSIENHIMSIDKGLSFAVKVTPDFFRKEALSILIQNPKLKLKALTNLFQKVSTSSMNNDVSIAQETNSFTVIPSHPHLQRFLKDSTILFILFAALADICVDPTMTVCPILVFVGLIASGLWIFQINNIFSGIF